MGEASDGKRTDTASRIIRATPRAIFRAFLDPEALASWLPPKGMTGRIQVFEPHKGGSYRMVLFYDAPDHSTSGKSSEHTDIISGQFIEIVADERIVQAVDFESEDAAFGGTMTISWSLTEVQTGTRVTVVCENVPCGISREDHDEGLKSTLENLANHLE